MPNNWNLNERILLLDGAMGTMLQRFSLQETDFRGERFADAEVPQKGNNDLLCLTRPDVISAVHEQYLQAGADIIETCTFNSQKISMADYKMELLVREINIAGARLARQAADKFATADKPRFVVGSVGPTNKTASLSPDVNRPGFRAVTFDDLYEAYLEQMTALIEGGVDGLLIETAFDTLNTKAALLAADDARKVQGKAVKILLSATVADVSGRTLSGQTIKAFFASVAHTDLFSIGLNCSFGAKDLLPYLAELSALAPCYVSAHPNAGLPNRFGVYDETPESMAAQIRLYLEEKLVNIIGGCCGTTPEHIAAIGKLLPNFSPRKPQETSPKLRLSGLDILEI